MRQEQRGANWLRSEEQLNLLCLKKELHLANKIWILLSPSCTLVFLFFNCLYSLKLIISKRASIKLLPCVSFKYSTAPKVFSSLTNFSQIIKPISMRQLMGWHYLRLLTRVQLINKILITHFIQDSLLLSFSMVVLCSCSTFWRDSCSKVSLKKAFANELKCILMNKNLNFMCKKADFQLFRVLIVPLYCLFSLPFQLKSPFIDDSFELLLFLAAHVFFTFDLIARTHRLELSFFNLGGLSV